MKILVINPKGGSGKSTVASQLIAPYLYIKQQSMNSKQGKIPYFQFDLHNDDVLGLNKSQIIEAHLCNHKDQFEAFLDDLEFSRDCVLDVGGNGTTGILLNYLTKVDIFANFDLVVLPFGDSDLDLNGAITVYKELSKISDFKAVQVLTRAKSLDKNALEDQFFNYFGDKSDLLDSKRGMIEHFKPHHQIWIPMLDDKMIPLSRAFSQTIYELAETSREQMQIEKETALKNNNKEKFKKINKNLHFVEACKYYAQNVIVPAFKILDQILSDNQTTSEQKDTQETNQNAEKDTGEDDLNPPKGSLDIKQNSEDSE